LKRKKKKMQQQEGGGIGTTQEQGSVEAEEDNNKMELETELAQKVEIKIEEEWRQQAGEDLAAMQLQVNGQWMNKK
jgi:hypothetical protein